MLLSRWIVLWKELTFRKVVEVKLLVPEVGKGAQALAIDDLRSRFDHYLGGLVTDREVARSWGVHHVAHCCEAGIDGVKDVRMGINGTGLASRGVGRSHYRVIQLMKSTSEVGRECAQVEIICERLRVESPSLVDQKQACLARDVGRGRCEGRTLSLRLGRATIHSMVMEGNSDNEMIHL